MADQIIDKAWSDVSPRDFVRWVTPRFVKYGVIIRKAGNSLLLDILDEDRPRALPDGRWYYAQFKMHGTGTDEYLCVIDAIPDGVAIDHLFQSLTVNEAGQSVEGLTVNEACEMIRMDPKQLRRHIRRGTIPATKHDDRWVIDGEALRSIAAKFGWV